LSDRLRGHITEIYREEGYGWLHAENGLLFRFHHSECGRLFDQFAQGMEVSFEKRESRAFKVVPVKPILPANGAPLQGFVVRAERGFAILAGDDKRDYFVHINRIGARLYTELEPGRGVRFTAHRGERGLEARDIAVLNC
jgi:cold shock CspA family protein